MTRSLIYGRAFLVSVCMLANAAGWAQQSQKPVQTTKISTDVAVTFASELSKPDPSRCCFWFKGGGVDAAVTFWRGLGIAATLTGDHASNVFLGMDENKISLLAGPRYTFTVWQGHAKAADPRRLQFFGQGLIGGAQGFDFDYDTANLSKSANEIAVQTGCGLNLYLTKRLGIRPIEVDFVRTQIGTAGLSTQNDMRLATGVTYHFETTRHRR